VTEVLSPTGGIDHLRARFSALRQGFAFMDAPGGSQVPDEVGAAIAAALRVASANLGAGYASSFRVKEILERAEANAARFLGCEPWEITFGPNMTWFNYRFSRPAGRDFRPGDEIIVSSLDHDGGVGCRKRGDRTRFGRRRSIRSDAGLSPARCPTSCLLGSTRRSAIWTRSAALTRSGHTSAGSASTSFRTSRARSRSTACRRWRAGCRPSLSTWTAHPPPT
jgi:hypothetical protein